MHPRNTSLPSDPSAPWLAARLATNALMVDENQILVDLLEAQFSGSGDLHISTAETISHIPIRVEEINPNIILIGFDRFTSKSAALVSHLPAAYPEIKIAVIASEVERNAILSCIDAGFAGVILKSMPLRSFVSALKFMVAGEVFIPTRIFPILGQASAPVKNGGKLSDKEISILTMIRSGMLNKEIAAEIEEAEATVKMHIRSIFRKIGAKNRTQAVVLGEEIGLI